MERGLNGSNRLNGFSIIIFLFKEEKSGMLRKDETPFKENKLHCSPIGSIRLIRSTRVL